MSKISMVLGDTIALYDRVTDARTGVPLDLSAYNSGSDTITMLFVLSTDSTKTVTKNAAPITLTGTAKFTNGSATVTGTGTQFYNEVSPGDWIKLHADSSVSWGIVKSIETDTSLTLTANYVGAGSGSAGAWDSRGKIACTLLVSDFTFSSVATPGLFYEQSYVSIGSVPHYGSENAINILPKLSSYTAP